MTPRRPLDVPQESVQNTRAIVEVVQANSAIDDTLRAYYNTREDDWDGPLP
jgi:hypothetical protein